MRPFLEEKLNQSFPDPSQFTSDEDFLYAAKTSAVFKKVIAEILQWVEANGNQAQFLEKKSKGELENKFSIGS